MFMEERHQKIATVIQEEGKITISAITARFRISDESARRELRLLEQKGICRRTHCGAIHPQKVGTDAFIQDSPADAFNTIITD